MTQNTTSKHLYPYYINILGLGTIFYQGYALEYSMDTSYLETSKMISFRYRCYTNNEYIEFSHIFRPIPETIVFQHVDQNG